MEKRNYVKPSIDTLECKCQSLIAASGTGSGGNTGDTTIAINILEQCFKIDDNNGTNQDINDSMMEKYLVCEKPDGIFLTCDSEYNENGISLTNGNCYLVKLTTDGINRSWSFTAADCSNVTGDFSGRVTVSYGTATTNCTQL